MLKTSLEELSANKVALTVEVEKTRVAAAYSSFFARAAKALKIPGFRQGKVPRAILVSHLGADAVKEQITDELLKESYPVALKEAKVQPISEFHVEEVQLKEGEPFVFKAVFEVRPKITNFRHNGFTATVPCVIIDDESINSTLVHLQNQLSKPQPVEDGELQNNDYFFGEVQVSVDGVLDEELSRKKGFHNFSTDNPMLLPMVGMKPNEERVYEYTVNREEDKDSALFGKTLQIKASFERMSRPVVPKLDDALAKEAANLDTLDELKQKIREDLEERARHEAENRAYDSLVDQCVESTTIEAPEAMIQNTIDYYLASLDQKWRHYGMSMENFLKQSNKDIKELRESFRERAIHETKGMLMVDAIAERENLTVSDADFRAEVERQAAEYNMPVEKILEVLAKNKGESNVRYSLLTKKVREFLLKNNEVHYDMVKEADLNKGGPEGAGTDSN